MKWMTVVSIFAVTLEISIGPRVAAAPPTGPRIEVVTIYEGMPASSVESSITNRVERWVNQAEGVRRIESRSIESLSVVRLDFRPDVNLDGALKQVKSLVLAVQPNLPPGTPPPVVRTLGPSEHSPMGFVVISGDGLNGVELRDLSQQLVRVELAKIRQLTAPFVLGGKERVTQIVLDAEKLKARNLSPADVIKIIESMRRDVRAGISEGALWVVDLRAAKDADKIGDLILRTAAGSAVRLRDVAAIKNMIAVPTEIVRVDGQQAVCIPIDVRPDADAAARKALQTGLNAMEKTLPRNVHVRFILDVGAAERQITVLLRTPGGPLADTETTVAEVEQFLSSTIGTSNLGVIFSDIGRPSISDGWTGSGWNRNQNDATIRIQLSDKATEGAASIAARLRRRFAKENRFAVLTAWFQASARTKPPMQIALIGKDLNLLAGIAAEVRKETASVAGAADVLIRESPPIAALTILADREKVADLGLTQTDLFRQAATALGAPPTQPLDLIRNQVTIPMKPGLNLEEALDTPISSPKFKRPVPLRNLVQLKRSEVPAEITHVDLKRAIHIWVNVEGRPAADVTHDIESRVKNVKLPKDAKLRVVVD